MAWVLFLIGSRIFHTFFLFSSKIDFSQSLHSSFSRRPGDNTCSLYDLMVMVDPGDQVGRRNQPLVLNYLLHGVVHKP